MGGHHRWLAAAALGLAAAAQARAPAHFDSVVQLNGLPAGAYLEETRPSKAGLTDTVKLTLVLNRLGSRVEISETDVYDQDARGALLGGHFTSSSSKDAVANDFVVKDGALVVTNHVGGKSYSSSTPIQGELLGPEGVRRLMKRAREGAGSATFQTFTPAIGGLAKGAVTYQGSETLTVGGRTVQAFKYRETFEGQPGEATLWTDKDGYTIRASQGTPFGPVEYVRGKPDAKVLAAGAALPEEVYEKSLAISNIRLPHARLLDGLTLELVKKPDAEDGWPDFASGGQKILSQTPRRLVLEITRPSLDGPADRAAPTRNELDANALIQTDLPQIRRIARDVVGDERDPWKAALKLQAWTNRHMTFDAGIAVASASELVRDRHGTCLGYSILLTTLARAGGIPARIRMGYVYYGDIWGGHAWVEVYAEGRWLPLDSAVYYPGVADPARIGASTETGAGGQLSGVGALARLYGKIDVKVLSYRLAGAQTDVPAADQDHTVEGDAYANRWLGLRVVKPAGMSFANLDSHWPANDVLSMKGPSGEVVIHQVLSSPDLPLADQVKQIFEDAPSGSTPRQIESTTWNGTPAIRFVTANGAGIAARKDDQLWIVRASGPQARALLDQALPGISIADFGGRPPA
jgi:hypothetical protein